MSAAAELNDDIDNTEVDNQEQVQETQHKEPGFISKEDWIESGRDTKDWRDPIEYRHKGELIKQRNELRREFDEQLKNVNLLHEIRLQTEREELLRLRDDAIDVADKGEVKRLDAKIANNDKQTALVQQSTKGHPQKPQDISEWEEENQWIFDQSDARTMLANKIFSEQVAAGKSNASALRAVDREISAKFSDGKRSTNQIVESSRTSTSKKDSATLTWNDLTSEEAKIYAAFPQGFKDKAAFLKAVFNERKGAK